MRKLKFENISLATNTSLKVHRYNRQQQCYGIGWHLHPEYEVVYIRNGNGLINVDTKSIPYEDGTLLFLGPDIPHTDFGNTDQPDALEIVVQFSEAFVSKTLGATPEFSPLLLLMERARRVLLFPPELRRELGPHFQRLPDLPPTARLLTFLACLLRMAGSEAAQTVFPGAQVPTIAKPTDAKRLEHVFRRINQEYGDSLTSSDLAADLGMTTNSFCRFIKANTRRSFTAFLNDFRLQRARDLLVDTELSIQEIRYACGFRDGPYFSRAFRRVHGVAPSVFRATKRG